MQKAVWGLVVVAGLAALLGLREFTGIPAHADPGTSSSGRAGELITLTASLDDGRQQLLIVDPSVRVMSLYHIDGRTGELSLKSVRNFHWDLQMLEFNGVSPLPREIRSLLER